MLKSSQWSIFVPSRYNYTFFLMNWFESTAMIAVLCVITDSLALPCPAIEKESKHMGEDQFTIRSIGSVHKAKGRTTLVLKKEVLPALKGLNGFSHVWVMWWLNLSDKPEKRSTVQVHPRGNIKNPLTGVFACRAPVRPNPIALSLCRILSVEKNVVEIEKIDAFVDTSILDLKPYIPKYDSAKALTANWVENGKGSSGKDAGD
jgi:tRNA (adenine37-N6)-methyltransferase